MTGANRLLLSLHLGKKNQFIHQWKSTQCQGATTQPFVLRRSGDFPALVFWREGIQLRDSDRLSRSHLVQQGKPSWGNPLLSEQPQRGEQSTGLCIMVLLRLFIYLFAAYLRRQQCCRVHVAIRRQLWFCSSTYGPQGSNSSHRASWQVPSPSELSHQPALHCGAVSTKLGSMLTE